ncbi:MAG: cytochrome c-type biogenesis protein CcmH [Kiloniellales bacterium]
MRLLLALVLSLFAVNAWAIDDRERLSDPALEERARTLFKEVRCVVCQNQSIDDSEAQIAKDLRVIIREQIAEGKDEEQILGFLTARYGDYVLLEPPFKAGTWLLWFSPLIVLLIGGSIAWVALRSRPKTVNSAPLTAEEQARLDKLMGSDRK